MAFDLTSLTAYVEEPAELVRNTVVAPRSVQFMTIQSGIKGSETINILNAGITLRAGATCSFTPAGDDVISQRTIATDPIQIDREYCMKDLEGYFTQKLLNAGADYSDDELPAIFFDELNEKIAEVNEDLIWQGDKSGGAGNMAFADGFIQLFDANLADVVQVSAGVTFSAATCVDVMKSFIQNCPENIRNSSNLVLYMGQDWFDIYQGEIFDLNNRYVAPEDGTDGRVLYTNIPIVVVPGLNGQNRIVMSEQSNMVVGTDLESDWETYRFWYSEDNDNHRFSSRYRLGTQVAFLENVVYYAE